MGVLVRVVLLSLTVGLLTAVTAPSQADVLVDDYVELPFETVDDIVALPGGEQVAVAGRDGPLTIVDARTLETTTLADTDGMASLSLSRDGTRLYGATRATGSVVEVDLATFSTHEVVEVNGCITDAIERAGVIAYVRSYEPDCTSVHLEYRRPGGPVTSLRPATGSTPPTMDLLAVPATDQFLRTGWPTSLLRVTDEGSLAEVASNQEIGGRISLSDDGTELYTRNSAFRVADLSFVETFDVTTLGQLGRSTVTALNRTGTVLRRSDQSELNELVVLGRDSTDGYLRRAAMVGDTMFVASEWPYTQARLHRAPLAASQAGQLSATISYDEPLFGGDPVRVSGTISDVATSPAGMPVKVTQIRPTHQVLGTTTAAADGTFALDLPEGVAGRSSSVDHAIVLVTAELPDGREVVDVEYLAADLRPRAVTLSAPAEVQPQATFPVTGMIHDEDGRPMSGQQVTVTASCPGVGEQEHPLVSDRRGEFAIEQRAGACAEYQFQAHAPQTATHYPAGDLAFTRVNRSPTTTTISVSPTSGLHPEDQVQVKVEVAMADGAPVAGAEVELAFATPTAYQISRHVTGSDGTFSVTRTVELPGQHSLRASWGGTTTVAGSGSQWQPVDVDRIPTAISVGAASPVVGDDFTITGAVTPVDRPVEVRVEHPDGRLQWVTTDAEGSFSVPARADQIGTRVWRFAYWYGEYQRYDSSEKYLSVTVQRRPSAVSATAPPTATVGDQVTITGQLDGPEGPGMLRVAHPDTTVTELFTSETGAFSFEVTPTQVGRQTWTVAYLGSDGHAPSSITVAVDVERVAVTTSLTTSPTVSYDGGGVLATLHSSTPIPHATLVRVEPGRAPTVVYQGPVPSDVPVPIRVTSTLRLLSGQDETRAWSGAETRVPARFKIMMAALSRYHGPGTIYPYGSRPEYRALAWHDVGKVCVRFRLLTLNRRDEVIDTLTSRCRSATPTDRSARWRAPADLPAGRRYRLTAIFTGNERYIPTESRTLRFRVSD